MFVNTFFIVGLVRYCTLFVTTVVGCYMYSLLLGFIVYILSMWPLHISEQYIVI